MGQKYRIVEFLSGRCGKWVKRIARQSLELMLALGALAAVVTCARLGTQPRNANVLGVAGAAGSAANACAARSVAVEFSGDAGVAEPLDLTKRGDRSTGVVGRGALLPKLCSALRGLAHGERQDPLRILWFGDSHTAADYLPNAVRRMLSEKVALGGPGYVSLGVPGYRHGMAKVWTEGNIEVFPHPPSRRSREDDGIFGLGGTRATMRDKTAYVTVKALIGSSPTPMNFELTYRLSDESDALRINVGGRGYNITKASADPLAGGLRQQRFATTSDATVEIRATRGQPQLFGAVLETQRPGLVIDTLGVNGARFGTLLSWHEETLALLVEQRRPVLVLIAYGTNEVFDPEPVERHAHKLELVLGRLRRGAPEAECVVIGPTDAAKGGESTHTRVAAMDAAERATAERLSCVYFSPFEVMAADGGFESWNKHEPPLALSDGIHLSPRGYAKLGEALSLLLLAGN